MASESTMLPLAGYQLKMDAKDTWACDNCWAEWKRYLQLRVEIQKTLQ